MSIRVPLIVKLYIYEVLFFLDERQRSEFISTSEEKRSEYLEFHPDIDSDYFESDSIYSLDSFLSVHPFKEFYFINSNCVFSREVTL